ncbi:MAG: dTDP-4-dehydrorhamnose 3,5-epimerase [Deltaproteobacteria bacterium]|nr:dTDP-4-dehydrorhamnose 3,5-epimerase [Deltaproteobacteria bacterium]
MKLHRTEIDDVVVLEPDVFRDARGFFLETYHQAKYVAQGLTAPFVQDNHSRSSKGTLRGLHAQRKNPQGKLVRAVRGEIWDVAVDLRPGSKTFGKWAAATLSEDNFRQIWVPPGFAHGFCVLSDVAEVEYKCTTLYDRADEIGVLWNDPAIGIPWPVQEPLLSSKDLALPTLAGLMEQLR